MADIEVNVRKILSVLDGKDGQECVHTLASSVVVYLIVGSRESPKTKRDALDRFIRHLTGLYEDSSEDIEKQIAKGQRHSGNVIHMNK